MDRRESLLILIDRVEQERSPLAFELPVVPAQQGTPIQGELSLLVLQDKGATRVQALRGGGHRPHAAPHMRRGHDPGRGPGSLELGGAQGPAPGVEHAGRGPLALAHPVELAADAQMIRRQGQRLDQAVVGVLVGGGRGVADGHPDLGLRVPHHQVPGLGRRRAGAAVRARGRDRTVESPPHHHESLARDQQAVDHAVVGGLGAGVHETHAAPHGAPAGHREGSLQARLLRQRGDTRRRGARRVGEPASHVQPAAVRIGGDAQHLSVRSVGRVEISPRHAVGAGHELLGQQEGMQRPADAHLRAVGRQPDGPHGVLAGQEQPHGVVKSLRVGQHQVGRRTFEFGVDLAHPPENPSHRGPRAHLQRFGLHDDGGAAAAAAAAATAARLETDRGFAELHSQLALHGPRRVAWRRRQLAELRETSGLRLRRHGRGPRIGRRVDVAGLHQQRAGHARAQAVHLPRPRLRMARALGHAVLLERRRLAGTRDAPEALARILQGDRAHPHRRAPRAVVGEHHQLGQQVHPPRLHPDGMLLILLRAPGQREKTLRAHHRQPQPVQHHPAMPGRLRQVQLQSGETRVIGMRRGRLLHVDVPVRARSDVRMQAAVAARAGDLEVGPRGRRHADAHIVQRKPGGIADPHIVVVALQRMHPGAAVVHDRPAGVGVRPVVDAHHGAQRQRLQVATVPRAARCPCRRCARGGPRGSRGRGRMHGRARRPRRPRHGCRHAWARQALGRGQTRHVLPMGAPDVDGLVLQAAIGRGPRQQHAHRLPVPRGQQRVAQQQGTGHHQAAPGRRGRHAQRMQDLPGQLDEGLGRRAQHRRCGDEQGSQARGKAPGSVHRGSGVPA